MVTKFEKKLLKDVDIAYVNNEGYDIVLEWREMIEDYFKSGELLYPHSPDMELYLMYFNIA